MTPALHLLQSSEFKPYTGEDFSISFSATETVVATLRDVVDLPGHPHIERKPFSLLFETKQKDHYYPQAIYSVKHPLHGNLEIFLVPMGFGAEGMQYEAVFS